MKAKVYVDGRFVRLLRTSNEINDFVTRIFEYKIVSQAGVPIIKNAVVLLSPLPVPLRWLDRVWIAGMPK